MRDMTFDETVKRYKAAEELLQNDALARAIAMAMKRSPAACIVAAAECGEAIAANLDDVAKRMTVSEDERRFGYPLPPDVEERRRRAVLQAELLRNFVQEWGPADHETKGMVED